MGSLNAERVAKIVMRKVRNGEPVVYSDAIKESGAYSPSIAEHPQKVLGTKSYQKAIAPHINALERHRNKIMRAMEAKDLSLEDYRILSESYDRMSKNLLLAQGKSTENIATTVHVVSYADSLDSLTVRETNNVVPSETAE